MRADERLAKSTLRAVLATSAWLVFAPELASSAAHSLAPAWLEITRVLAGPELRVLSVAVVENSSTSIAAQFITKQTTIGTVTIPGGVDMLAALPASRIAQPLFPVVVMLSAWPGLAPSRRLLAFTMAGLLVCVSALFDPPTVLLGSIYRLLYPSDDMALGIRALVEWLYVVLETGGRFAIGIVITLAVAALVRPARRLPYWTRLSA